MCCVPGSALCMSGREVVRADGMCDAAAVDVTLLCRHPALLAARAGWDHKGELRVLHTITSRQIWGKKPRQDRDTTYEHDRTNNLTDEQNIGPLPRLDLLEDRWPADGKQDDDER